MCHVSNNLAKTTIKRYIYIYSPNADTQRHSLYEYTPGSANVDGHAENGTHSHTRKTQESNLIVYIRHERKYIEYVICLNESVNGIR